MRKYWHVFRIALAERFVYRADFFIATFLRFTPIITTIALWGAVYAGAGEERIGSLSYRQMVAYYLLVMVARAFGSMPGLASSIAVDIREGNLRKFIIQPVNYVVYHFHLRMAHKAVYFLMAAVPYAILFYWCRAYLPEWPAAERWPVMITSLMLTFVLGYAINLAVGLMAFWFLEVTSFLFIFMVSQYFLSGHQFPLSLLPDALRDIIAFLPFAYETYYPVMILLGAVDVGEAWWIVGGQVAWIAVLGGIIMIGWRRGLRRYAAFGG